MSAPKNTPRKIRMYENRKDMALHAFSKNCLLFLKAFWGGEGGVFYTPFAKCHAIAIDTINNSKKLITVVDFAREFGKTKLLSFGYIMWAVMFRKYSYILHMSFSLERKGEQIMRDIQRGFMSPKFIKVFGNLRGKFWGKHKIHIFSEKWKIDCIIEVTGADQSVFGASEWKNRPDLIILDDIETIKGVKNSELVDQMIERFQTEIIPAAEAKDQYGRQARIIVIGTPLAPYTFLTEISQPKWKSQVTVLKFPALVDSLEMSERLGVPIDCSIWEQRWSTEFLRGRRQLFIETGAFQTWMSQYMLDPIAETPMQFSQDKLKTVHHKDIQELLKKGKVVTTVDMAYTERNQNDFTGIVTALHLEGSRIIYLESSQVKLPPNKLFDVLYDLKEKYKFAKEYLTACESKSYQYVKQYFWEVEMRTGKHFSLIPLKELNKHKNEWIAAMIPYYEVGLLEFVEGTNKVLLAQMWTWYGKTVGHDDVIDSASKQLQFVEISENKVEEKKAEMEDIPEQLAGLTVTLPEKYNAKKQIDRRFAMMAEENNEDIYENFDGF